MCDLEEISFFQNCSLWSFMEPVILCEMYLDTTFCYSVQQVEKTKSLSPASGSSVHPASNPDFDDNTLQV